nr:hypothetical protein Iba_chr06aCG0980 [Ipomoea batatas]
MAVKMVPRIADVMTFTITENFAASGLPPPSSFETLTLTEALKPRATMSAQSCKFTQMDTESTATAALLSPPTMRITAVKYHSSKLPPQPPQQLSVQNQGERAKRLSLDFSS